MCLRSFVYFHSFGFLESFGICFVIQPRTRICNRFKCRVPPGYQTEVCHSQSRQSHPVPGLFKLWRLWKPREKVIPTIQPRRENTKWGQSILGLTKTRIRFFSYSYLHLRWRLDHLFYYDHLNRTSLLQLGQQWSHRNHAGSDADKVILAAAPLRASSLWHINRRYILHRPCWFGQGASCSVVQRHASYGSCVLDNFSIYAKILESDIMTHPTTRHAVERLVTLSHRLSLFRIPPETS